MLIKKQKIITVLQKKLPCVNIVMVFKKTWKLSVWSDVVLKDINYARPNFSDKLLRYKTNTKFVFAYRDSRVDQRFISP